MEDDGASAYAAPLMAMPGDTMVVLVHHVAPDRQGDFETFVDAFMTALYDAADADRLSPDEADVLATLRVLFPAEPSVDGTLAYLFLLDPAITSVDFAIPTLLARTVEADRTEELMTLFEGSLARAPERYVVTPSGY